MKQVKFFIQLLNGIIHGLSTNIKLKIALLHKNPPKPEETKEVQLKAELPP